MKIIITASDMTKFDSKLKKIRRKIPTIVKRMMKQITLDAWRKMVNSGERHV